MIHTGPLSQYTSDAFIALLQQAQLTPSMSRKGNCWNNAVVQSFLATLKQELIIVETIGPRFQLRGMITDYIDRYYNPVRIHSTLDYKSPMECEKD